MIDFDNPVKTEITSDKINFKSWSIYPIHQYHKYRFYSLCKSAPLYLKRRKIRLNLVKQIGTTIFETKKNQIKSGKFITFIQRLHSNPFCISNHIHMHFFDDPQGHFSHCLPF